MKTLTCVNMQYTDRGWRDYKRENVKNYALPTDTGKSKWGRKRTGRVTSPELRRMRFKFSGDSIGSRL